MEFFSPEEHVPKKFKKNPKVGGSEKVVFFSGPQNIISRHRKQQRVFSEKKISMKIWDLEIFPRKKIHKFSKSPRWKPCSQKLFSVRFR
jgi:hypothetical protein